MDLVNFTKKLKNDSLSKLEIIDLKNSNNKYVLGLRSFPFKVIWGKNQNTNKSLKNLNIYIVI